MIELFTEEGRPRRPFQTIYRRVAISEEKPVVGVSPLAKPDNPASYYVTQAQIKPGDLVTYVVQDESSFYLRMVGAVYLDSVDTLPLIYMGQQIDKARQIELRHVIEVFRPGI